MKQSLVWLACVCVVSTGCFRTTYTNVVDSSAPQSASAPAASAEVSSWQHFFLYGWVPEQLDIDAAAICGGAGNVESIKTQRTFLQGLVAAVAGVYVNIYSPFDGKVVCKD